MGTGKKESSRREREGKNEAGNAKVKGENFYRNAKKIKNLNILREGKAQRNADGKIVKAAAFQSGDKSTARVEPNRKWFTNTRVISQDSLTAFRDAVAERSADPYSYLLRRNKLPMGLIDDSSKKNGLKHHQAKIAVRSESFNDTFGPKAQRKRVKLNVDSLEALAHESSKLEDEYLDRTLKINESAIVTDQPLDNAEKDDDAITSTAREPIFSKGQSKRIWNELYKVIDSSDVVIHVLDARDPLGTRCRSLEKHIQEEASHKHLIFVLNKCDLVPTSVAALWVRFLSKEYPTLAFHASMTNSFGKGSLIQLLRQFSSLHSERKQISIGFVGYPNTGKSSIINTLRKKKVCTVAPIPGQTKVWQYISLMKRILLIDCPGVVPPNPNDVEEDILLRGVVRVENVENPSQYVKAVLSKCKQHHVERTYGISGWTSSTEFLDMLARKSGRLLKGGEPDSDSVAKMVLNDFLRGKLPWYIPPPTLDDSKGNVAGESLKPLVPSNKRKRSSEEPDRGLSRMTSHHARNKQKSDTDMSDENVDAFSGFNDYDNDDDDDDNYANGPNNGADQDEGGVHLSNHSIHDEEWKI